MPKITIEVYEIKVKMIIRKDYWHKDNSQMTKADIEDKIQTGIETPIEQCEIEIIK